MKNRCNLQHWLRVLSTSGNLLYCQIDNLILGSSSQKKDKKKKPALEPVTRILPVYQTSAMAIFT